MIEETESVKRGKSLSTDLKKEAKCDSRSEIGEVVKQLLKTIKSNDKDEDKNIHTDNYNKRIG